MASELSSCEGSDEASENELLDRSLSVWRGWSAIEKEDFTPVPLDLHTACSIGQYDWVRFIIARNEADVLDKKNKGGWTALMYACYIGHDNVVHLLVKAGCQMNKLKNPGGHTPLMLAASCGNENVARTLVRNGAELEVMDKSGWTALFHATYAGHQNFVAYLLEAGANINAVEPTTGLSTFMLAAAEGHEIIVHLFLQNGVNVQAKSYNGDMARSLALIKGYMKIVSLIDNHTLPSGRLRAEPGLDFYLSSSDEDPQPKQAGRGGGPGGPGLKKAKGPKGPSIRDGPEAIARMIDRTRPDDIPLCTDDAQTPKGYMSFSNSSMGDKGETTQLSYRDVTSPINPEDYKDTSGGTDVEDFGEDSNAFSKTGAITIKSSSSSSGGLVAALGLSREGSLDSDDSTGYDLSSHHGVEEDVDSSERRDEEDDDDSAGGGMEREISRQAHSRDLGDGVPTAAELKFPPPLPDSTASSSDSLKKKPQAVVSPLRDYFPPHDASFPPVRGGGGGGVVRVGGSGEGDQNGGNHATQTQIDPHGFLQHPVVVNRVVRQSGERGGGEDGGVATRPLYGGGGPVIQSSSSGGGGGAAATASSLPVEQQHHHHHQPPRDSMSQAEIVQAYLNSILTSNTTTTTTTTTTSTSASTAVTSIQEDQNHSALEQQQQQQQQQRRRDEDRGLIHQQQQQQQQQINTNIRPSRPSPQQNFGAIPFMMTNNDGMSGYTTPTTTNNNNNTAIQQQLHHHDFSHASPAPPFSLPTMSSSPHGHYPHNNNNNNLPAYHQNNPHHFNPHHQPPPPPPNSTEYYSQQQQQQPGNGNPYLPPRPPPLLPPQTPLHHHHHHHHHHLQQQQQQQHQQQQQQHHHQHPYSMYSQQHNIPPQQQPPPPQPLPPSSPSMQNFGPYQHQHPSQHQHQHQQQYHPQVSYPSKGNNPYLNFPQDIVYSSSPLGGRHHHPTSFDPASFYKSIPSDIYYSDMNSISAPVPHLNVNTEIENQTTPLENMRPSSQSSSDLAGNNPAIPSGEIPSNPSTRNRNNSASNITFDSAVGGNTTNQYHLNKQQPHILSDNFRLSNPNPNTNMTSPSPQDHHDKITVQNNPDPIINSIAPLQSVFTSSVTAVTNSNNNSGVNDSNLVPGPSSSPSTTTTTTTMTTITASMMQQQGFSPFTSKDELISSSQPLSCKMSTTTSSSSLQIMPSSSSSSTTTSSTAVVGSITSTSCSGLVSSPKDVISSSSAPSHVNAPSNSVPSGSVNPTPNSLNPAPNSLNPAQNSLNPAPISLNSTPNYLNPAPNSISSAPTSVMLPGHTVSQPVSQSTGLLDQEGRGQGGGAWAKDLPEMLSQLGLAKYVEKFEEQDVDLQVFLSLTDNDLKEVGIKLFGPRKKMANGIARWHSQAPLPSKCLEQAYADRLEGEMQELAIQLNQAYANEERLKAQVLQEQQLRSVTESCLVEVRGHWERTRQTLEEAQVTMRTMGEAMARLRLNQKELRKSVEGRRSVMAKGEGQSLQPSPSVDGGTGGDSVEENTSAHSPPPSTTTTPQTSTTAVGSVNSTLTTPTPNQLQDVSAIDLIRKSEKYVKEILKGLSSLVYNADKVLKTSQDLSSLDKKLENI